MLALRLATCRARALAARRAWALDGIRAHVEAGVAAVSRCILAGKGDEARQAAKSFRLLALVLLLAPALPAWEIGSQRLTWYDADRGGRAIEFDLHYPSPEGGENGPVAPAPEGGFATLVFGHGFLMSADRYGWLRDAWVPGGGVLALPRTEGGFSPSHQSFALDLAFLARQLRQLGADPDSPFHGAIAAPAVGGHSMGGGAAVLAAAGDPELAGLLALAPAETNPSAVAAAAGLLQPALLLLGGDDCVTPTAQHGGPIFAALGSDCAWQVELAGASHCQFADPDNICSLGELFCPQPGLNRAEQQARTAALARPWLAALRGDHQGLLAFEAQLDLAEGTVAGGCLTPPALAPPFLQIVQRPEGLRLSWSAVPGATHYRIEGATLAAPLSFAHLAQAADTIWALPAELPERLFRVRALQP
jgi:hypothetical protein